MKNWVNQKNIIFIIALFVAGFFLYMIKDITLLFFASFVVASAINPLVDKLNKKMNRGLAITLVFLAGFLIMTLFLVPFIHITVTQTSLFLKQVPQYYEGAEKFISHWTVVGRKIIPLPDISQILATASGVGQDVLNRSIGITVGFLGGLAIVFTLAMIVLYMLLDKVLLKETYLKFFPLNVRDKVDRISVSISRKVGGYVVGQLLSMIAVGLLTTIGLFIIGVDFAILLGAIAGILDIIPVVGPILAIVPALIIAFAKKPILALWVIVVYSIVQWAVNTFIKPAIFSKFLDLHPLVIIFALLVTASTMGVVGVILAPAIAALVCVLIQELYINPINKESAE